MYILGVLLKPVIAYLCDYMTMSNVQKGIDSACQLSLKWLNEIATLSDGLKLSGTVGAYYTNRNSNSTCNMDNSPNEARAQL